MQTDGNIRISYLLRMAAGLGIYVPGPFVADADLTNGAPAEDSLGAAGASDGTNLAAQPEGENGIASTSGTQASPEAQLDVSNTFRLLLSGLTSLLLVLGGLYILLRLARANGLLPLCHTGCRRCRSSRHTRALPKA